MAKHLSCLIVENEPDDRAHLKALLENNKVRKLDIVGCCANGIEAFNFLQKQHVDLIFLDMNMPGMNGEALLTVLRGRQPQPIVVIISIEDHRSTAWDFREFTYDHLKKPLNQNDLDQALKRLQKVFHNEYLSLDVYIQVNPKEKRKLTKNFDLDDLAYIENERNEKRLHCINDKHPDKTDVFLHYQKTMENLLELLPADRFFRINQSCIINKSFIREYHKTRETVVLLNGKSLPVARTRKRDFEDWYKIKPGIG